MRLHNERPLRNHVMSTIRTTYDDSALAGKAIERDARALLGHVMGLVAVTVGFAAVGAYGYATRRDLSSWGRTLFWALLALLAFGIVAIFVSIPNSNLIYAVAGLGIFGAFTIFDFNRLRRASADGAVPIAASIFLDIFNVFLFLLSLFGGQRLTPP